MPREEYQTELEALREDVLYMSELVRDRLREAVQLLEQPAEDQAKELITSDHAVNELYLDLEQRCIELLALQQPVAGDLRFVASSFKILTDLERIGDLAVNLAEYATEPLSDRSHSVDIQALATVAEEMVADAMTAYAETATDRTYAVAERDTELDALCAEASETVVRELLETEGPLPDADARLQDVSRLLLTIRDLERVGDHAVNIAARTLYMVDADEELIY